MSTRMRSGAEVIDTKGLVQESLLCERVLLTVWLRNCAAHMGHYSSAD